MNLIRDLFRKDFAINFFVYTFALIILIACSTPGMAQSTELRVNISPQGAVDDGAMWRYKEKDNPAAIWSLWRNSGQSMELYASTFLVEFKDTDTDDWLTPNTRTVTVNTNEHKIIYATYQSSNTEASLTVILNPTDIQPDARWSLYYLKASWPENIKIYIVENLKSGDTHTFDYSDYPNYYITSSFVKDLARPINEAVNIIPGENKITREYKDLVVGVVHIFGNKLEYGNNEFKAYGTTQWAFRYSFGTESVRYIRCKADLRGTFSPAVMRGRGTLHINGDIGALDTMFTLFSDKTFYKGKFLLDAETLKAIETSLQKPIWEGIFMYSMTVNDFQIFKYPKFGLSQTATGIFDLIIFSEPSILRFEELKAFEQDDQPQITGDVIWEGAEVPGLFKIEETEVYIDTTTNTFTAE